LLWLGLAAVVLAYPAKGVYSILRWGAAGWFPGYAASRLVPGESVPDSLKHVVFVMVDHYEPGRGARGTERSAAWLSTFRSIAERHRDAVGRPFQYSWFYAYDHKNAAVLQQLNRMVHDGYGEVDLHWHHPPSDSVAFPTELAEALAWFRGYGALAAGDSARTPQYGFIHGNWALDGSTSRCGVTNELTLLQRSGCYADFTFSTISTPAQPRRINCLYYATDTPAPKSYDDGEEVRVGHPVEGKLLIFEGPLGFDFGRMALEYGAVEDYALPSRRRIEGWIDTNIHVRGRPEWVFVKVYSHGAQSEAAILGGGMERMLDDLRAVCEERRITLHFMTAREAFNVVKAAEAGLSGDPEAVRDYRLPPPLNRVIAVPDTIAAADSAVAFGGAS
jgi:hypothetical protein